MAARRRCVLEQVSTFNPYLCSDEKPELGLRIRQAGYRFLELDCPIVRHYNDAPVVFSTILSRRRRNFLLGIGQGARYYLTNKRTPLALAEGTMVGYRSDVVVGHLAQHSFSEPGHRRFYLAEDLEFVVLSDTCRYHLPKRCLVQGLVAIFNWRLMAEGFVKELLMSLLAPESFQANLEVIQEHANTIEEVRAARSLSNVGTPPDRNSLPAAAPSH